jgi:hypothetical protein
VLRNDHSPFEALAAASDADALCRLLLAAPVGWAWGRSTRHNEAVDLLARVHGTSQLSASLVALLLCTTCRRWSRVTAELIVAIEGSGLLTDADLDELAESCLVRERVISYRLAWVASQWLEIDVGTGTSRAVTVDEHALAEHRPTFEPPLRRWASRRALRNDPERLEAMLIAARDFPSRHRDALIHGLLDAADVLDAAARGRLIGRGLQAGQGSVRVTALDRLCELDGPEKALRRALDDPSATVRAWRPRPPVPSPVPSLFGS